jgi:ABC-2 type transport system permease protein
MTSITPTQMLTGKILALGLAGLLQTLVFSLTGFGLLRLSGQAFNLPASFQLSPSIILWGILFFLLGYGVYASLMAGVGALVPNLREGSHATTLIIIPLVIPLMMISILIEKPDDPISVGLSLFPLTSPVSMMTRLAATTVPLWQILLSASLIAITAIIIIRGVAGMFRAQNLLSGQPYQFKVFIKALFGLA